MRSPDSLPPLAFILVIALSPQWTGAESTVYRGTDATGRTIYSDRPALSGNRQIPKRVSPEPSAARYDEAVARAESERIALQRSLLENRQPRKIVVYDPRNDTGRSVTPMQRPDAGYGPRARWDPRLPDSPVPSLERNYQYNGR